MFVFFRLIRVCGIFVGVFVNWMNRFEKLSLLMIWLINGMIRLLMSEFMILLNVVLMIIFIVRLIMLLCIVNFLKFCISVIGFFWIV